MAWKKRIDALRGVEHTRTVECPLPLVRGELSKEGRGNRKGETQRRKDKRFLVGEGKKKPLGKMEWAGGQQKKNKHEIDLDLAWRGCILA